ncbi:MAG: hypothetical protein ACXAD7_10000 [Candidatus Kariarchaeaceae archaeon]
MYDKGQFKELHEITKANLGTIEAKAWYVMTFIHVEDLSIDRSIKIQNNLDSIQEFEQEFEENKENFPFEYGLYLCRYGHILRNTGAINKGINIMEKGLSYLEKSDKEMFAGFSINLGAAYARKGEYDLGLQILKKALEISLQGNNLQNQGFVYLFTGVQYFNLGENDEALGHFLEGYKRLKKSQNKYFFHWALYQICQKMILSGKRGDSLPYLKEYEAFIDEFPKYAFEFKTAKALYLKTSHRLRHKVDAERMYRSLINDSSFDNQEHLEIYKHLCDLLMMELKLYGEREVFKEIQSYINLLFENSKRLHMYPHLVDAYILKSRILLIDGDFDRANEILKEGLEYMREENLPQLEKSISQEMKKLENEFLHHQSILQSNTSFSEKIEKLQIQEYFRIAIGYKDKYEN